MRRYRDSLLERGLSAGTLNHYRSVVRGAFALAVAKHGAESNPGLAFEWVRSRRTKSDAITFYRPDEVLKLAANAANAQDAALFRVRGRDRSDVPVARERK